MSGSVPRVHKALRATWRPHGRRSHFCSERRLSLLHGFPLGEACTRHRAVFDFFNFVERFGRQQCQILRHFDIPPLLRPEGETQQAYGALAYAAGVGAFAHRFQKSPEWLLVPNSRG